MKKVIALLSILILSACASDPSPSNSISAKTLDDYYKQTLTWTKCEGVFECAELTVPLDYTNPGGEAIQLALKKFPALNKSKKLGAIVVNPGGPGGSGVDYITYYDYQFSKNLYSSYDMVGFDPRGVMASAPVDCLSDSEMDDYLSSDSTPDNAAEISAFLKDSENFAKACVKNTGKTINFVSTIETAKDLDILRAALGETKLNYLGKSYGTELGAVYAHNFPTNVGKFVLDGAVDMSGGTNDLTLGQLRGFSVEFKRFAQYCAYGETDCSLGQSPEQVIQTVSTLMKSLDSAPLDTDQGRPLTEALAWTALIGPQYSPADAWDWLIMGLEDAVNGDGTTLMDIADWFNGRNQDGTYEDNLTEAYWAITCSDNGPSTQSPEELLSQYNKVDSLLGPMFAWSEGGCYNWTFDRGIDLSDVSAPTSAPIVVIGTTYDPATPDAWAKALAQQLQVGVYINFNGDGHTAYKSGSKCIDTLVDDYFISGVIPTANTSCEPNKPLI
ncbi:MAG: alpha/beta hydrolase [Actinobacteria bacterium]|nr:alpha/beta hydrolase [Actinomycetota bacterium]